MATEILSIPEENLREVIKVIRTGLETVPTTEISQDTREHLADWCAEEEEYLDHGFEDEEGSG